jgi:hypothetical protein
MSQKPTGEIVATAIIQASWGLMLVVAGYVSATNDHIDTMTHVIGFALCPFGVAQLTTAFGLCTYNDKARRTTLFLNYVGIAALAFQLLPPQVADYIPPGPTPTSRITAVAYLLLATVRSLVSNDQDPLIKLAVAINMAAAVAINFYLSRPATFRRFNSAHREDWTTRHLN